MAHVSRNKQKWLYTALAAILALVLILVLLQMLNITPFFESSRPAGTQEDKRAATTSKAKTAQSDFSQGEQRSTTTTNPSEGTVADTGGTVANLPPSSQWANNGPLTVYTPVQSSVLHSGDTLSGAYSGSGRVSFRLIDSVSGVISQGALVVVNGKYSGVFNFTTNATEGRVDIFNQAADGTESNNVSITVRFQ